jgi:hypothetical protein
MSLDCDNMNKIIIYNKIYKNNINLSNNNIKPDGYLFDSSIAHIDISI